MKKNEISKSKKIALIIYIAIIYLLGCGIVSAQIPCAVSVPAEERLVAGFYLPNSPEAMSRQGATSGSSVMLIVK